MPDLFKELKNPTEHCKSPPWPPEEQRWPPCQLTDHLEPSHSIHEQGRDDVPRQHGQAAQEADEVNQEVVILLEVHVTALLLLQKGGVDKATVDELMLVEVWGEEETSGSCNVEGELRGVRQSQDEVMPLPESGCTSLWQSESQSQCGICQRMETETSTHVMTCSISDQRGKMKHSLRGLFKYIISQATYQSSQATQLIEAEGRRIRSRLSQTLQSPHGNLNILQNRNNWAIGFRWGCRVPEPGR